MKQENANKYARTKARLTATHSSLRQWALLKGLPVSSVYAAASGQRHGERARQIRAALVNDLAN